MADPTPPDYSGLGTERVEQMRKELRDLQAADGTQRYNAVDKVKKLITDFRAELDDYLATLDVYTKSETDAQIANPPAGSAVTGDTSATGSVTAGTSITAGSTIVAGGTITANGNLTTPGILVAVGSRSLVLTSGYAGAWLDAAGNLGISPSSMRYKSDIDTWVPDDITRLLELRGVMFRYDPELFGTDPDGAKQIGFIAEECIAAGFPEFITYDECWNVQGINYDRMVVALLELGRYEHEARVALKSEVAGIAARLDAAGL